MQPDAMLRWFPAIMRYLGLFGIVFMTATWLIASRVEPGLLAAFGSLVGVGTGVDALMTMANRTIAEQRKELSSKTGSKNAV